MPLLLSFPTYIHPFTFTAQNQLEKLLDFGLISTELVKYALDFDLISTEFAKYAVDLELPPIHTAESNLNLLGDIH